MGFFQALSLLLGDKLKERFYNQLISFFLSKSEHGLFFSNGLNAQKIKPTF